MAGMLSYVIVLAAFAFWLTQVLDLLFRDLRFFEGHIHRLTWFLVLVVGNIGSLLDK